MAQPKNLGKDEKKPLTDLRAFADARGRPAVFLFLPESMSLGHVLRLRNVLGNQMFEELDLVVNSGGGDIHAAFQIVELLRLHTKRLEHRSSIFP